MDEETMDLAGRVAAAWTPPTTWSTAVFVGIVAAVAVLFVLGVRHADRSLGASPEAGRRNVLLATLGIMAYLGVTGGAVASGVFVRESLPIPWLVIFFGGCNLTAVVVALSPLGRRLAVGVAPALLLAPQALRLPLELVLHDWYLSGTIPVQMTFEGHNFDIVTGILAFAVAVWARRGEPPRAVLLAVNTIGLGLLLAVMTIAMRSSPIPIQAYPDPPLVLAFHLPYAWIVPMCVSAALFGHVVAFRALLGRAPDDSAAPRPSEEDPAVS